MIKVLEGKKKYVNENRQPFYDNCIRLLKTNRGLFPLIQKYQQRYLNGLRPAHYKSSTFCVDNMHGIDKENPSDPTKTLVEKVDDKTAILHFHFGEIRRNKKKRFRDPKTGAWKKETKRVILRKEKDIDVKVRYSTTYHGDFKDYADTKVTQKINGVDIHYRNSKNYRWVFGNGKNIRIIVAKDRPEKEINERFTDSPEKFEGVDANFRDNAIIASDGWQYNWSPLLVRRLKKFLARLAIRNKNIEKSGSLTTDEWNSNLRRQSELIHRMAIAEMNYAAFLLVQHLKETGKEVLVAEDLEVNKWKIKGHFDEELANKTMKQFLGFGQWKHILERACKKAEIVFALTNPMYTSQTCAECGLIEKENRPFNDKTRKKDTFDCLNGDNHCHSDINAARVIRDRMANPRIRVKLQWYDRKNKIWKGTRHKDRGFYQKVYTEAYKMV